MLVVHVQKNNGVVWVRVYGV